MKKIRDNFFVLSALAAAVLLPLSARAFEIKKIADTPVAGDFVLASAKTEVRLNPGDKVTRSISLLNRSGRDLNFTVSVEDFSASVKPNENIDLLGAQSGLYSLKDYLKPEISAFTLHQGEIIALPVAIAIPQNAQPGGLYGAVIFSTELSAASRASSSNIRVIPSLASLFFVRINGDVLESGALQDLTVSQTFSWGGPLTFEYNYKNTGSVYLNPYGELSITDIFGRTVYSQWISPYFVLPGAIRQQKEIFKNRSLAGMYQATLKLNRGYGNRIDEKSLYFFVLPLPYIIIAVIALILLGWLIRRSRAIHKKTNPV